MVADTKLTDWETDFGGQDTNTPKDSSTVGTLLGSEFRALKYIVKRDLVNSLDDWVVYAAGIPAADNNKDTPARGHGKGYAIYESKAYAEGVTADIFVWGLKNRYNLGPAPAWTFSFQESERINPVNTGEKGCSFWVKGDWTSVIYPGTKVCVVSSGDKDQTCVLSIIQAKKYDEGPLELGSSVATLFTFHPPLRHFPTARENSYNSLGNDVLFQYVIGTTERDGTEDYNYLKVKSGSGADEMTSDQVARFVARGRRIQFCRYTKREDPRTDSSPHTDADYAVAVHGYTAANRQFYMQSSWCDIMKGSYQLVGDYYYIHLYKYAWQIAYHIDKIGSDTDNPEQTCKNLFGEYTRNWAGVGNESGDYVADTYSKLKGGTDGETYFTMRMSDPFFAWDPSVADTKVASLTDESTDTFDTTNLFLIGTQSGNRELSAELHEVVTFQVTVSNDNVLGDGRVVVDFPTESLKKSISNFNSAAMSGRDYRVFVKSSFRTGSDETGNLAQISNPEVKMNEWETNETVSEEWAAATVYRDHGSFTLQFRTSLGGANSAPFPSGVSITYDVQIVLPYSNGRTFYPIN